MFEELKRQAQWLPVNTTVVVVSNFMDCQGQWIWSQEQIQQLTHETLDAMNKSFEIWNLVSCLIEKFGMKVSMDSCSHSSNSTWFLSSRFIG